MYKLIESVMKVTDLYYLIENLRYILLSEHMYFPAISPFLSDWVIFVLFYKTYMMVVPAQYGVFGIYKVPQFESVEHKQKQSHH